MKSVSPSADLDKSMLVFDLSLVPGEREPPWIGLDYTAGSLAYYWSEIFSPQEHAFLRRYEHDPTAMPGFAELSHLSSEEEVCLALQSMELNQYADKTLLQARVHQVWDAISSSGSLSSGLGARVIFFRHKGPEHYDLLISPFEPNILRAGAYLRGSVVEDAEASAVVSDYHAEPIQKITFDILTGRRTVRMRQAENTYKGLLMTMQPFFLPLNEWPATLLEHMYGQWLMYRFFNESQGVLAVAAERQRNQILAVGSDLALNDCRFVFLGMQTPDDFLFEICHPVTYFCTALLRGRPETAGVTLPILNVHCRSLGDIVIMLSAWHAAPADAQQVIRRQWILDLGTSADQALAKQFAAWKVPVELPLPAPDTLPLYPSPGNVAGVDPEKAWSRWRDEHHEQVAKARHLSDPSATPAAARDAGAVLYEVRVRYLPSSFGTEFFKVTDAGKADMLHQLWSERLFPETSDWSGLGVTASLRRPGQVEGVEVRQITIGDPFVAQLGTATRRINGREETDFDRSLSFENALLLDFIKLWATGYLSVRLVKAFSQTPDSSGNAVKYAMLNWLRVLMTYAPDDWKSWWTFHIAPEHHLEIMGRCFDAEQGRQQDGVQQSDGPAHLLQLLYFYMHLGLRREADDVIRAITFLFPFSLRWWREVQVVATEGTWIAAKYEDGPAAIVDVARKLGLKTKDVRADYEIEEFTEQQMLRFQRIRQKREAVLGRRLSVAELCDMIRSFKSKTSPCLPLIAFASAEAADVQLAIENLHSQLSGAEFVLPNLCALSM